ncbi:MAG TPA: protein kinase [Thermoanaerobaculia bacterium]|nr:protein kinase [Thermoanaerobaculia bacterium]
MSISRGSRLGSYEITSRLGAGGMGEVYRARDTRLQRDVAIKALPAEFAGDAERLARFQREARLLASLNHPNVAAIYGLEEVDGARYLVLEIVEGESLAQRLAAGPLPVEETLAVCAQIAAGVSAAHDAGVIHRDLKPGNVMVRHDGSVKVLDFGLAKGADAPAGSGSSDLSASPTLSLGTQQGVILGTAAYMSPEQARGRPLDKRTDVWSFGCILYECLTGRQVFRDDTVSDTLASIIRSEPDWKALPADTPAKIRDLLKRCLRKDPKRRLHDIADARLEIEEALSGPEEKEPSAPLAAAAAPAKRAAPIWIGLGILAGALGGAILSRAWTPVARRESAAAIRSVIVLPADMGLRVASLRPSMAFSPDGGRLVFRAVKGRINQLYLRDLGRADAVPIPGTEGAFDPFFSPDGEWLAFFVGNELKKVALSGGMPTALSDAPPVSMGGTWGPDGSIIFAPRPNAALARLPAGAKAFKQLTKLDANRGEHGHVWPQLLPDGENVLLVVRAGRDFDDIAASNVAVHSLKTGQHRVLVEGSAWARYVGPGYLLFTKGTTVFAATCDPRKWELTGPPAPLIQNVLTSTLDGAPYLAASDNGLLAWAGGGAVPVPSDTLLWVDRSGKEEALPLSDRIFFAPRLSPDGKRLAVASRPAYRPGNSVAIYDIARGVLSTLTPEPGRHFAPVWSPDGLRIAFSAFEAGDPVLAWRAADGSGPAELLTPGRNPEFPSSFSPDGRALLYTAGTSDSLENMDLWLLSLEGKREHRAWLAGPARELAAFFSPDGRSVAYVSNETGRNEVYAQPYPGPGPKIKVSTDGGAEPAWAPGGREIFYRTADSLMVVPVETQPTLSVGTARALLPDHYDRWGREDGSRNYDVSPDGSRFLFIKSQDLKQEPVTRLNLMTNWPAAVGGPRTEKK